MGSAGEVLKCAVCPRPSAVPGRGHKDSLAQQTACHPGVGWLVISAREICSKSSEAIATVPREVEESRLGSREYEGLHGREGRYERSQQELRLRTCKRGERPLGCWRRRSPGGDLDKKPFGRGNHTKPEHLPARG
jgi:hypothetical protein